MISFLLYLPQFLHTRWGTIRVPQLLHLTRVGALIFQFALLLSLLAFEDLFLGHIDIFCHLTFFHTLAYYTHDIYLCQVLFLVSQFLFISISMPASSPLTVSGSMGNISLIAVSASRQGAATGLILGFIQMIRLYLRLSLSSHS